MASKALISGVLAVTLLAGATGSVGATTSSGAVELRAQSAVIHLGPGAQALTFRLREPSGVILLYRLDAPQKTRLRASVRLPGLTVPLWIATSPVGPNRTCSVGASRVSCTAGEEWCPMPAGTWIVRVRKFSGPEGKASLWFRVGAPRGAS
jgi:hypothetical protein